MSSPTSVFTAIGSALASDPALGANIKGVLCFELGDDVWCVDCLAGTVTSGAPAKPADCTITMKAADFVALASGKLSGMSAYMSGKMKLKGQVKLAQQFGGLAAAARKAQKKAAAPPAPPPDAQPAASVSAPSAPAVAPPAGFASNSVFARIAANLKANPALLKKVDGTFLFRVSGGPDGSAATWTVDAKAGSSSGGSVAPTEDAATKPDCTIAISDEHLVALATGKLSPTMAYMKGNLKLSGKAALAQKLAVLLADGKRAKL